MYVCVTFMWALPVFGSAPSFPEPLSLDLSSRRRFSAARMTEFARPADISGLSLADAEPRTLPGPFVFFLGGCDGLPLGRQLPNIVDKMLAIMKICNFLFIQSLISTFQFL